MQTQVSRLPASQPMEHRWGERVTLDSAAWLVQPDGSTVRGCVRNASISGALIATEARLPVYSMVTVIVLTTTGPRRRSIELPACVVRTAPDGIAVEWRDMGVPTLISLLREAGGDAARLCTRDRAFG